MVALSNLPSGTSYQLDIYGDGPERPNLEAQIRTLNLTDRVALKGRIPNESIRSALPAYDAIVLASLYDGWGAVVNEAMDAGVVPVVSRGARMTAILTHLHDSLLFDPDDIEALTFHIVSLYSDPQLLSRLRANSIETISQYSPDNLASQLVTLVDSR